MNWEFIFKVGVTGIGGFLGWIWGGWDALIKVLVAFVVFDYATGMLASHIKGTLSSKIGFVGIAKKVTIFFIVAVSNLLDEALGSGNTLRNATIFFYLGNELLSFVENVGKMGVPLPPQLTNAVAVLKGKGESK